MGCPFIDYIIADPVVIPPEAETDYSEAVVRLPDSYQANDRARAIDAGTPTRQTAGLPDDGFVFCCFNSNYKITPSRFASHPPAIQENSSARLAAGQC